MRAHVFVLTVALMGLTPAVPASAANRPAARVVTAVTPASSPIKDEHVRPVTGTLRAHAIPDQLPAWTQPGSSVASQPRISAAATSANALLTLADIDWDSLTAVLDDCK